MTYQTVAMAVVRHGIDESLDALLYDMFDLTRDYTVDCLAIFVDPFIAANPVMKRALVKNAFGQERAPSHEIDNFIIYEMPDELGARDEAISLFSRLVSQNYIFVLFHGGDKDRGLGPVDLDRLLKNDLQEIVGVCAGVGPIIFRSDFQSQETRTVIACKDR